jgi:nitrite reductase/ring-hydroxylating ferredoxin subunit
MSERGPEIQRLTTNRSIPPDARPLESQPRWRRDFPIDWEEDEYVARRELVKFIVLTSAAFAVGQGWLALRSLWRGRKAPLPVVAIASVNELPVGGAKTFTYPEGSTPRLLIRTGSTAFVAYDRQCTHLLCPVVPAVERGCLHCPCHNGWFDLQTGRPVGGPPQRALPKILLQVVDETVYATGVEESST